MMKSKTVVENFCNSDDVLTFLGKDLRGTDEVGCVMDPNGNLHNIVTGTSSGVSIDIPENDSEKFTGIHTHPSVSGTDISDKDVKSTNYPNINFSIILSQRMFETVWDGVCFKSENMEVTEKTEFVVECDGTTNGPPEDRYISDPKLTYP